MTVTHPNRYTKFDAASPLVERASLTWCWRQALQEAEDASACPHCPAPLWPCFHCGRSRTQAEAGVGRPRVPGDGPSLQNDGRAGPARYRGVVDAHQRRDGRGRTGPLQLAPGFRGPLHGVRRGGIQRGPLRLAVVAAGGRGGGSRAFRTGQQLRRVGRYAAQKKAGGGGRRHVDWRGHVEEPRRRAAVPCRLRPCGLGGDGAWLAAG
jgi:hypothetical protein